MTAALLAPLTAITAVFGLVFGSFFNVVIWRVPRQLSVVHPRSACPQCGTEIRARDTVPVLSWLLLRGKCRDCKTAISAQYPAVELLTGAAFAIVALAFAPALLAAESDGTAIARVLELAAFLVLAAGSVVLAGIDISVHRLPNVIVAPLAIAGALLLTGAGLLSGHPDALLRAAIGGAAAYALFFAIAFIKPGAMGFGDVKLAGALGIFLGYLGWGQLTVGIFAGFLLGGVFGIVLMLIKRAGRKSGIPYGPWMLAGAWVGIFGGEFIADAYLSFVGLV